MDEALNGIDLVAIVPETGYYLISQKMGMEEHAAVAEGFLRHPTCAESRISL
ncbi:MULTISPECIES: hypothetical protein [Chloroflexus]|jgi:hypothetical protein|uniref:hypothetical protein n=1 Tax=Chloroflexus TaxID=1107 RepID=UPI0012FF24BF|nr:MULTISPECIES: hypothetical protein [Chloroflexus]